MRDQGLTDTDAINQSQLVKAGECYLKSLTLAWTGQTAGAYVYLRNGLTAAATTRVLIALPATSGTLQLNWPDGKYFPIGLFYDEGQAPDLYIEFTYK